MSERMNTAEFRMLRDFLRETCGLYFSDDKCGRAANIISSRMSEIGIESCSEYQRVLTSSPRCRTELAALADVLTVGETHFLRNKDHWRAFAECVVPWILERNAATGQHRLRIWSAGCSTGEEAYTAGIVLRQSLPNLARWSVEIIGTDLSPAAIAAARRAVYTENAFRGVPEEIREEYFDPVEEGRYRPRADIRDMVSFRELNLLDPQATDSMRDVDVVFCRNVLIYFDATGVERVMTHLHRSLRPDGYLFLGHSESLHGGSSPFASLNVCNTFIYKPVPCTAPSTRLVSTPKRPTSGARTPAPPSSRVDAPRPPKREAPPPPKPVATPAGPALDALRARAIEHLCAEENAEARKALEEILLREPDDSECLLGMALLLAGSGHSEGALQHCDRILEVNPMSADAFCVMGLVHEGLGEDAIARREFEKAVYLDDGSSIAHFRLGGLHHRARNQDTAKREFINTLVALPADREQRVRLLSGGFSRKTIARVCERRLGVESVPLRA